MKNKYPELWDGLTICGTPEHPCTNGWTKPHYPLGTTQPCIKLKVKPYKSMMLDKATCKICNKEFRMAHNEDEHNQEEIENIEETGRCSKCYDK